MKLWHVGRMKGVGYDEYAGFLIRASTELAARKQAAAKASDEGPAVWLNPKKSTCTQVHYSGKAEVIMSDFRAA